jgi:hypothetical protein
MQECNTMKTFFDKEMCLLASRMKILNTILNKNQRLAGPHGNKCQVQYVVQFSDSKVFSHYILRFKVFSRFKFVQMTTTSHGYITLRDTSLTFFSFSVISKTSSSFSSPYFGQLVRYSDTYNSRFSLEGKLYFDYTGI